MGRVYVKRFDMLQPHGCGWPNGHGTRTGGKFFMARTVPSRIDIK